MTPTGLFPFPGPDAVIAGIQLMFEQGIALGTQIATLVMNFVLTTFRFIA